MPSRRVIFLGSIVLFVGLVFVTILQATGLEFTGPGFSLSRGSALSVLGTSHARVLLNGADMGTTPLRLTRITPGLYTVRLQRDGFLPWEAQVPLTGGKATILGPITLVPTIPTTLTFPRSSSSISLVDQEGGFPFLASAGPQSQWTITDLAHTITRVITLPGAPTAITRSPNGNSWVITCGQTEVFWNNETPWTIPVLSTPIWTPLSETIIFGLHDGRLIMADALSKTTQDLGPASSLAFAHQSIWSTAISSTQTILTNRDPSVPSNTRSVTALDGQWTILRPYAHRLILQSNRGETYVKNLMSLDPNSQISLGSVERLWWTDGATPIWQHQADILQLGDHDTPELIDRWPADIQAAWWLNAGHIVMIADQGGISARGTSAEEGQHILGHWDTPGTFLSLDENGFVWYQTATSILKLSWR